jgi:ribose transport system ATP-binding protein
MKRGILGSLPQENLVFSTSKHCRMTTPLLRFVDISKRFGGTLAVNNVSFDVNAGEIVALLGENGAGKSTLIKLLAGIYACDSGEIHLQGQLESQWRSADRSHQPVAFIHQDLGLVEWMTVAENVALGMGYPRRFGLIDWTAAGHAARRVMARVGCNIDPARRVFSLTRAEKSLLAIGRALEVKAKLLVLDEPSASLPMADVARLFALLRDLRAQGMAIIYVSHRLDEVMAISDRAVVMRDGKLVAVRPTHQTSEAELVNLIVGKALAAPATTHQPKLGQPVLALRQAASGNAGPVSFKVAGHEILGLVGLRGGGQEAISQALFGREPLSAGSMSLFGKPVQFSSCADAIKAGVAYVASERLEENLAASMTVLENLFPNPALHGDSGLSLARRRKEAASALNLINRFGVNPPVPSAEVQQLSGGNQQKVVLARWFHLNKPLIVLEEPTAGVDVGAKRQIYALLAKLADEGSAVVVMSTDFEEVATVCTRVLVFRGGLVAAELKGADISVQRLLALAAGAATPAPEKPAEKSQEKSSREAVAA